MGCRAQCLLSLRPAQIITNHIRSDERLWVKYLLLGRTERAASAPQPSPTNRWIHWPKSDYCCLTDYVAPENLCASVRAWAQILCVCTYMPGWTLCLYFKHSWHDKNRSEKGRNGWVCSQNALFLQHNMHSETCLCGWICCEKRFQEQQDENSMMKEHKKHKTELTRL